uniref:Uncharacterized protein n=1 Tax=Siphoviridae sp. ctjKY6 TaxID=2825631 RepID=A0A8S5UY33_9CAUD|nr:MAG TPA: hypothetical protein [Siphoviridae sp. ctjKY6]
MLFYDHDGFVCAYIRNRGFVCVDTSSSRFDEKLEPGEDLTVCDEAAPYTNPYGDVLLSHYSLPYDMCYNTVLQELVPEDWHNMFTVEDGERNPYTEMLFGEVNADLVQPVPDEPGVGRRTLYRNVWLSYDSKGKSVHVHTERDGDALTCLFAMKKDDFIRLYHVRCIDW